MNTYKEFKEKLLPDRILTACLSAPIFTFAELTL